MTDHKPSVLSLQELQTGVKEAIHSNFSSYLWVHAELSEVNINRNGHCYLELIEKQNDQIIAKVRATIWAFTFRMLKPYFETSTGYQFSSGIKVSLKVSVEFHEIYGLSLNIKDIDPNYTIGDVELQKRKIINRLEAEGVMHMNAELDLPLVVQNIAVISSVTAAGFGDWKEQLKNNTHRYKFSYTLFEAQMQGENTGDSIIRALDEIYKQEDKYDLVVIIRGGGSKTDLAGFDHYELATNIAQFPLPILTGIGHERDESIADLVAHTALKTPTAVADFLIENNLEFDTYLSKISQDIVRYSTSILDRYNENLRVSVQQIQGFANEQLRQHKNRLLNGVNYLVRDVKTTNVLARKNLNFLKQKITIESQQFVDREQKQLSGNTHDLEKISHQTLQYQRQRLSQIEHLNKAFNPALVLERGYAIIKQNKQLIVSAKAVKKDQEMEIIMKDGIVKR